jgi:hypothetical protein
MRPPAGALASATASAALASATASAAKRASAAVARRSPWWGELLAVTWLAWLYDVVTGMAPLRQALALAHGRALLSFEQSLHMAPERALNRWLAARHTLGVAFSYYYDNAHFLVTFALLAWLWWKRADIYRPLRNALVAMNLIGLLVFWLYPVAPPRMLGGFSDVIASSHALGSWHTGSLAADADQLAAMPSLHIAWALWCGVALWRMSERRWLRTIALSYPLLTTLVVLSTANHYLLDVLAGVLTALLALALVRLASVPHVTKLLRSLRPGRLRPAADDA